ncbi:NADH-quinone oxidoreductase subunit 4 [compost metagenome]
MPAGEIYDATEAANGELGFYITSDGSGYPYRVRVRPPCFLNYAAFPEMIEGYMISDAAITLASLNIIAGELDR